MWILNHFYSLLAFIGTFVYLRLFGARVRGFVSPEKADQWTSLRANAVFCAPTLGLALVLLFLRGLCGWVIISPSAIWLSLLWDGFYLLPTLLYYRTIARLRASPSRMASVKLVGLDSSSSWPHFRPFRRRMLGSWWIRLALRETGLNAIFGRALEGFDSGTRVRISVPDFKGWLGGDLRYVDMISHVDEEIGLRPNQAEEIPHLMLRTDEEFRDAFQILRRFKDIPVQDFETGLGETRKDPYDRGSSNIFKEHAGVTSNSYPLNRALNTALKAELWDASCNICLNTPQVIATTWKLFHFQDEMRLRLVTLFNAADLIQRLIGSFTLSALRDTEELGEILERQFPARKLPPGTQAEWNSILEWSLSNSITTELDLLRAILLSPRPDFEELQERLAPFWKLIGHKPAYEQSHTLAAWDALRIIRNKTIGHGAVGLHLKLHPLDYLIPLHGYFLAVMRDVVALDLALYGFQSGTNTELVAFSQGLRSAAGVDRCDAWMRISDEGNVVNVSPYIRFHARRVLFPNRTVSKGFQYVDYKPQTIDAPSFITLPVSAAAFREGTAPRADRRSEVLDSNWEM